MKKVAFWISLIALMLIPHACEKAATFVSGEFEDQQTLIVEEEDFRATYFENEEEIKIRIEDLKNTSDNRTDEFPALDFLMIRVDMNNNNLPDNEIDKSYSISSGGVPCMQFILNNGNASTTCMDEVGFDYEVSFESSSAESEKHIIYELKVRKENIFTDNDTVGLIFIMNGEDSAGANPFLLTPLFKETFSFSL